MVSGPKVRTVFTRAPEDHRRPCPDAALGEAAWCAAARGTPDIRTPERPPGRRWVPSRSHRFA